QTKAWVIARTVLRHWRRQDGCPLHLARLHSESGSVQRADDQPIGIFAPVQRRAGVPAAVFDGIDSGPVPHDKHVHVVHPVTTRPVVVKLLDVTYANWIHDLPSGRRAAAATL